MNLETGRKTPWHLWAVGILTLLFNLGGAADYVGTHMFTAEYMAGFEPDARAYFTGFPAWQVFFWALGVWGALGASILLLARSRFAIHAGIISLIGLAVMTVVQYTQDWPASIDLPGVHIFNAVIWAVQILLLYYNVRQFRAGLLR